MARQGRPPLTEDVLRERTAEYCRRYRVTDFNEAGLPAYPAGKRESRQHRDWVNLLKAWSRLRQRSGTAEDANRVATVLQQQRDLCPICARAVHPVDVVDRDHDTGEVLGVLHADCYQIVRVARTLDAGLGQRLATYLDPAARSRKNPS
jgi:hypothetical protein